MSVNIFFIPHVILWYWSTVLYNFVDFKNKIARQKKTPTICWHRRRSYRSSSCPGSSPAGHRSTAGPQAGSPPSRSSSPQPGPATRTSGCRLPPATNTKHSQRKRPPRPTGVAAALRCFIIYSTGDIIMSYSSALRRTQMDIMCLFSG